MKIDLHDEISRHYERLRLLAEEAAEDDEESYSSRASAMNGVTSMLKELIKEQEKVINMDRLAKIEQITIETIRKHLSEDVYETLLKELEAALEASNES